ncbi:MAG: NAD(P)-dependent oxidoreductase [Lachnospiraceae bacterium]|nr:NAD(P)-dependent oxidoreductase [Lachnospiraceae bacterium]
MKLGFIGLGTMGTGMARNLLRKNGSLTVYTATQEKRRRLAAEGFDIARSYADLEDCGIIFLSLPDAAVVEKVMLGEGGLIHVLKESGAIVVDTSTISPDSARMIASAFEERAGAFLDAPVSGMKERADAGTLTVMAGGLREAFDEVRPYLDMIGTTVLYMGASGCGQAAKMINNVAYDINAAGIAELLPLALRLGLAPEQIGAVLNSGSGRSYASEYFIPRILEGRFTDAYPIEKAFKDLTHAEETEAAEEVDLPMTNAAAAVFRRAIEEGFGALSKGGLIRVKEEEMGVLFRRKDAE